jgi:hypothetical protein
MKTKPIRLSVWAAAHEFQVTYNKVRAGMRQHSIQPGPDGKYSLKDLFLAVHGDPNSLENRAKEAKYRRIIEEAAEVRRKVVEFKESHVRALDGPEFCYGGRTNTDRNYPPLSTERRGKAAGIPYAG